MDAELVYQLALTEVPHIGNVHARILVDEFGSAERIFKAKQQILEKMEGIGTVRARSIKSFNGFSNAESEIRFIEKYGIRPLFLTDPSYPKRLLNCYDPPSLLYYKGRGDLNASKIISVIGTRNHTAYGKEQTEQLIRDLSKQQVVVVSGMAYGIDALAHRAALKNQLCTVGVLAHGLDQIYPAEHAGLARDILKHGGGLLTEFRSKTKPDKHNFPTRNRIVAGMCDATVVMETGIKGGSMITAELANGYNRDVFAFPGRVSDPKSTGSNLLIRNNKAMLLTGAADLVSIMGWEERVQKQKIKSQKELFIQLTPDEKQIVDILKEKELVPVDELSIRSGLSSSAVAAAMLSLELQGLISLLPGKLYRLIL